MHTLGMPPGHKLQVIHTLSTPDCLSKVHNWMHLTDASARVKLTQTKTPQAGTPTCLAGECARHIALPQVPPRPVEQVDQLLPLVLMLLPKRGVALQGSTSLQATWLAARAFCLQSRCWSTQGWEQPQGGRAHATYVRSLERAPQSKCHRCWIESRLDACMVRALTGRLRKLTAHGRRSCSSSACARCSTACRRWRRASSRHRWAADCCSQSWNLVAAISLWTSSLMPSFWFRASSRACRSLEGLCRAKARPRPGFGVAWLALPASSCWSATRLTRAATLGRASQAIPWACRE